MALAAFKEEFDDLLAEMPAAPFNHILLGVSNPGKAQDVLDSLRAYEAKFVEWRNLTLIVIHDLRQKLGAAKRQDEVDALRYAVDNTLPAVAHAITEVGTFLKDTKEFSPAVESRLEQAARRSPANKRFVKHVRKHYTEFVRASAAQATHMHDAILSLAWEFDPDAQDVGGSLSSEKEIDDFFARFAAE